MTKERQDIKEDFYAGNYKEIEVICYEPDGVTRTDLTSTEVTYAIFSDENEILLAKSSNQGIDQIELTDAVNGELVIKLYGGDTAFLNGSFRHHVNVVDTNGYEETILSGKINIFKAFAKRFRTTNVNAYLSGG